MTYFQYLNYIHSDALTLADVLLTLVTVGPGVELGVHQAVAQQQRAQHHQPPQKCKHHTQGHTGPECCRPRHKADGNLEVVRLLSS